MVACRMPSGVATSRVAVLRYRTRLFMARLSMGIPSRFNLASLVLAIVGAWSVIYQVAKWVVPGEGSPMSLALAGAAACVVVVVSMWFRLTRRPQDIFSAAARSVERAEALRLSMVAGMSNDVAYENLARLYEPIIDQVRLSLPAARVDWPSDSAGNRCLVVTIAPEKQEKAQSFDSIITDIEGPRGGDWTDRVSTFASSRQAFMATIRRDASLSNSFGDEAGANIVLARVSAGDGIAMSVNTATYGQIVRTSDSLVNEFAVFAHLSSRSAFRKRPRPLVFDGKDLLKVLPWRRQVHSWDDQDALLIAPRRRAAGLGVSLSLASQKADGAEVYVARRSSKVGTYPDVLHVVPSGMMNARAQGQHTAAELAALPRLTMMSEFLEECFDVEELAGHSVGNFAKRVEEKAEEFHVTDLDPLFTGLAVDLLNLRTEVCGVLDLTDRQDVVDAFNLSWEYTHTERLRRIELDTKRLALTRSEFVQSGIGSIHLAAEWFARRRSASGSV
jgi:hypothetical protein